MEIGSFYEIDPKSIDGNDKNLPTLSLEEVHKYGKKSIVYTASGREAISYALKCLEKEHPDISKHCLMPAYMCDTVFFPFEQNDWTLSFYHIDRDMTADQKELQTLIESVRPSLLFIHPYYGVDTWKSMRSFLHIQQQKGLVIMEDMTQSYYLRSNDYEADYIIGSLRKWYAVPDGGFVATDHETYDSLLEQDDYFTKERLAFLTSKWEYLYGNEQAEDKRLRKEAYLADNRRMEEWLDHTKKVTGLSDISRNLLTKESEENSKAARNENLKILQEGFANRNSVKPVFDPDTIQLEAPLYFPVYVKDRASFQKALQKQEIYAPVLWPIGEENADLLTETEQYIYEHILVIPMDQRYGEEQMRKIVAVLDAYEHDPFNKKF